jgi:hypothetical protein
MQACCWLKDVSALGSKLRVDTVSCRNSYVLYHRTDQWVSVSVWPLLTFCHPLLTKLSPASNAVCCGERVDLEVLSWCVKRRYGGRFCYCLARLLWIKRKCWKESFTFFVLSSFERKTYGIKNSLGAVSFSCRIPLQYIYKGSKGMSSYKPITYCFQIGSYSFLYLLLCLGKSPLSTLTSKAETLSQPDF